MRVAIEKVKGVDTVTVSLNRGLAEIRLEDENEVTVDAIRKVVRRNGFTPKATDVKVRGKIVVRSGKSTLEVTGTEAAYELQGDVSMLEGLAGKEMIVEGEVPESEGKKEPRVLVLRGVSASGS